MIRLRRLVRLGDRAVISTAEAPTVREAVMALRATGAIISAIDVIAERNPDGTRKWPAAARAG